MRQRPLDAPGLVGIGQRWFNTRYRTTKNAVSKMALQGRPLNAGGFRESPLGLALTEWNCLDKLRYFLWRQMPTPLRLPPPRSHQRTRVGAHRPDLRDAIAAKTKRLHCCRNSTSKQPPPDAALREEEADLQAHLGGDVGLSNCARHGCSGEGYLEAGKSRSEGGVRS